MRVLRRAIPLVLLPLAVIACAVANSAWLRAFPPSVLAIPLFGAALLSVLAPLIVIGIGLRHLWLTVLIDVALLVFYELFVTLRDPGGFGGLYEGLVHGPAQLLSVALPLVSPRTLLVAPVALCWLSGSIVGECVARGWQSVLPYLTLVVAFGLSYAGTARAIPNATHAHRYDTLLAAGLLLTLLLMRAARAWITQEAAAEATQPDGALPMRSLAIGTAVSVLIALAVIGLSQSSTLSGPRTTPARVPPLDRTAPLTPLSFVSGLRPTNPRSKGRNLFTVTTDSAGSNYIPLASVDYYDGDGWTFNRTFRPSGGVVPSDIDRQLRRPGRPVVQEYQIDSGQMTTSPWMPSLYRPQRVTGISVNIDAASGMIVPSHALQAGQSYTVRSEAGETSFGQLRASAVATGYSPANLELPQNSTLIAALSTLVTSLQTETGTQSTPAIPFLQAVASDFRTKAALVGAAPTGGASATPSTVTPTGPRATATSPTESAGTAHAGGTSFADVLASIRQFRSASPEQFATLMCLLARQLNVPARLVTGFRVPVPHGASALPAGSYRVNTAEAWTWVEVPVEGKGWVVLDPSPSAHAGQQTQPSVPAQPSASPTQPPSQNPLLTRANAGGHAVAPKSSVPHARTSSAFTIAGVVLITLGVVAVLLIAALLLRKRLRATRRRRRGDPRRRLLGAWQESLDMLQEAGLPDLTHATSREVARITGERFGGEPAAQARYLGDAANAAIFSPTYRVGTGEADAAWQAHAGLSRAIHRRLGWRGRVGSGLRYHRQRHQRTMSRPQPGRPGARR